MDYREPSSRPGHCAYCSPAMSELRWMILMLLLIGLVNGLSYWLLQKDASAPNSASIEAVPPAATQRVDSSVPDMTSACVPSPILDQCEAALNQALRDALGHYWLPELFESEDVSRRIVSTVDWLGGAGGPLPFPLFKPAPWGFETAGKWQSLTISPDNYARYRGYVRLCESLDPKVVASIYRRFYPSLQQAYRDLGHPTGNFGDRMLEVFDGLLATPATSKVLLLTSNGRFKYADPSLESLSAGQKILVRIGSANASKIKIKLMELRRELSGTVAPR